jgi:5-(carboxyamino)imidazole ribonucleotide mutase
MQKVVVIMGSRGDFDHSKRIADMAKKIGVECILRVASAHKVPLKVMDIIKEYENDEVVFITVAGRSNALSGFVDANTTRPVISSPPYGDKFAGNDLYSSVRMPSGVCPMLVLEPEEAALAALKILALKDKKLTKEIQLLQNDKREEIEKADMDIRTHGLFL